MATALWMKDDLRIEDNPAVAKAFSKNNCKAVIYINDPTDSCVTKTQRRLHLENEALDRIAKIIAPTGAQVFRLSGKSEDVIASFCAEHGITRLIANQQSGDLASYRRDVSVTKMLRETSIEFHETANDGIGRGSQKAPEPFIRGKRDLSGFDIETPEPISRLWSFLEKLPSSNYKVDMWRPGPDADASSRLSIDVAMGSIGVDRIFHSINIAMKKAPSSARLPYIQFKSRLEWRRSFVQMFERQVEAFPWGKVRQERETDDLRMNLWRNGETGYPLVDAGMKDLAINGWVNFRMRQVVGSFALDLLDLDMHLVGVALGSLFDDYCPGIHWPQIGLQAGMMPNRGPRIINPIKQAKELDPEGHYVRSLLPYLANVSDHYIHEPWLNPAYKGPEPIVNYTQAAREARARYPSSKPS